MDVLQISYNFSPQRFSLFNYLERWCRNKMEVKNILESGFTIPSLKEMENCINRTRERVCHYYHPDCVFKPTGNGYTYFSRKGCRESCISFYVECEQTFQFLSTSDKILRRYCRLFPVSRDMGKLPDCQEFLAKDIQKIEQCKLAESRGKSYELKNFRYCETMRTIQPKFT